MTKIALVLGEFHRDFVQQMAETATQEAVAIGLHVTKAVWVPGSVEKPLVVSRLLQIDDISAVAVLGIIEKGETQHGLVIGQAVVRSLIDIQVTSGKPVGLGILGPGIEPHQIKSRLDSYAVGAVRACRSQLRTLSEI